MTFKAYYIDDRANPQLIKANRAEMAAWQFVQQQPRTDTSQVIVESQPSVPWPGPEMTHYRACDLVHAPAPSDEAEPELAIRLCAGPEPSYVVSGSMESLHTLATRLLRALEQFPTRPNPLGLKGVYGVPVIPGDGSRLHYFLNFEADADLQQYWARRSGLAGFWRAYGRFAFGLLRFVFACVGMWTVAKWII